MKVLPLLPCSCFPDVHGNNKKFLTVFSVFSFFFPLSHFRVCNEVRTLTKMYFQAFFCQILMALEKVMPTLITDVIWKNFFPPANLKPLDP